MCPHRYAKVSQIKFLFHCFNYFFNEAVNILLLIYIYIYKYIHTKTHTHIYIYLFIYLFIYIYISAVEKQY